MATNEHGDKYLEGVIVDVKKKIEEDYGLKLILNYPSYIYLDGRYGDKSPFAGKYAKEFPASITREHNAGRFKSKESCEKCKIYIGKERKYVVFLSRKHRGVKMSKEQNFKTLIEALTIIHKTTEKQVIDALKNGRNGCITAENEDTIKRWLDPSGNPERGKDSYKVARCLVWYIAKHNLEIPSFSDTKFPYEHPQGDPDSSEAASKVVD